MTTIDKNQKVTLAYSLHSSEGELLEEVPREDAITYIHGYQVIFPRLEQELDGRSQGEQFSLELKASDAFGEFDNNKISIVDRKELENIPNLTVGMEIAVLNEPPQFEEKPSKRDHFWTPQDPSDLFNDDDDGDDLDEEEDDFEEEIYIVKELHDLIVVLDANHPFAGLDIKFDVEILRVEPASVQEIEELYKSGDDIL